MSFGELPDLGKIGKRVGKRLRDILVPPVHNGPSTEDRLAQRLHDSLKGLVYFDNFDEISNWKPDDVDPVQQANTPLLERPAHQVYDQQRPTSPVLLCHDYSGGYHQWEGVRPPCVQGRPYSCKYLQYVEIFVYFSHKLICVPPASWINLCHRNGVKILGTFILEGQGKSIKRMFDEVDDEYVVARRLADMAESYGFDGWLLNIEAQFPFAVQHPISNLTAFIRALKRFLGPLGTVVWYDAITKDNEVDYQNALTWKNVDFALAADMLFTNYKWTQYELNETKSVAEQHGIKQAEVYFGVDVWAQNTNMPGPPRVTYPPKGGGGTMTGLATRLLAENGFSTAIFAPGWPYEHFSTVVKAPGSWSSPHVNEVTTSGTDFKASESEAEAVDRSMWEGRPLPDHLSCNCKKGQPHHREGYQENPISNAAHEYPAGSATYLETNFQQAFAPSQDLDEALMDGGAPGDDFTWLPRLGSQAMLPHHLFRPENGGWEPTLDSRLLDNRNPCLRIGVNLRSSSEHPPRNDACSEDTGTESRGLNRRLCLYKLNLTMDTPLRATAYFINSVPDFKCSIGFYTRSISPDSRGVNDTEYRLPRNESCQLQMKHFGLESEAPRSRIVEIGIYYKPSCERLDPVRLLDLYSLVIKPTARVPKDWTIGDIKVAQRRSGCNTETRLVWRWQGSKEQWPASLPWSNRTGPFSVFTIYIGQRERGQAHCLEFPVRSGDDDTPIATEWVDVRVEGRMFGGDSVSSARVPLRRAALFEHV